LRSLARSENSHDDGFATTERGYRSRQAAGNTVNRSPRRSLAWPNDTAALAAVSFSVRRVQLPLQFEVRAPLQPNLPANRTGLSVLEKSTSRKLALREAGNIAGAVELLRINNRQSSPRR